MFQGFQFDTVDFVFLSIYLIAVFIAGFYFSKHEGDIKQYFLGGRNIGWFVVGASMFVTTVSSEHVIGNASSGYTSGFGTGNFAWMACPTVLLLAWFFIPYYFRSGIFTVPELIERRFNRKSSLYLSIVSIFSYVVTKISITLFAGAILLEDVLGWDKYTSSLVLIILTGIYTIAGGARSIAYTGVVHMVVLIGGSLLLTIMGIYKIGGISELSAAPKEYFDVFRPANDPQYPWTGMLFGAPILAIWYWCTDQYIVQRTLTAKNIGNARLGAIFSGYLMLLPVFLLLLPGVIAHILYPDIDSKHAYSYLITDLLGPGMKGIVIASLLAALMSSLAASLNSSSTLITLDVYRKIYPKANEFKMVNFGRLATFSIVILSILWLSFLKYFSEDIIQYLQSVQSYIAPPIAVVFIVGLLWKRATKEAAITVLITGGIIGLGCLTLNILDDRLVPGSIFYYFAHINFLHLAIILFFFYLTLMITVSLITKAPTSKKVEFLYDRSNTALIKETPTMRKINIASSILLLVILITLWMIF